MDPPSPIPPKCIASTGSIYQCSIAESQRREAAALRPAAVPELISETETVVSARGSEESNYFKSAQWSADGTCIMTSSEDNRLCTFVIPPDLLEERPSPHNLLPYSTITSPEPIYATDVFPHFNLQDPSTTLHLSSPRCLPIALHSALQPTRQATYPLIHGPTETYLTPHSLLFTRSGTHFLAGTDSLIALFDVSRPNSAPAALLPTIPSKRKVLVGGGVGMKGIVSALACSADGLLAAGTFTRCVGLYDAEGSGASIAVFGLASEGAPGRGVTQLLWSPCGRYLYVAERDSDGVLVYDIRGAGKMLGRLRERGAGGTNQRLGVDLVSPGAEGADHEVWAGGRDGCVRAWSLGEELGEAEGGPQMEWRAHDDPVTSTIVHPSGSVVATASGQRNISHAWANDSSDSDSSTSRPASPLAAKACDNSLKIWRL